MQKARRHPNKSGLRPFVGVRFQVLFHSSVRSAFHLSLTVLVHYRSLRSIQPYRMVPVDSVRISRVPTYSGYQTNLHLLHVRDYHPVSCQFPMNFHLLCKLLFWSYNPRIAETNLVWANPFSIASTQGITFVFSSSGYLDVSVLRVSLSTIMQRCLSFKQTGCPIRISWNYQLFAPTPSFSQLITSFFASESLGIHHTPFFSYLLFSYIYY